MTLRPKVPTDLTLAPVAAGIDRNLQGLREKSVQAVDLELQVQLDRPPVPDTQEQRAAHVLRLALRDVELHGWHASITDDGSRLHLSGGSVTIDLGLGPSVAGYINDGAPRAVCS